MPPSFVIVTIVSVVWLVVWLAAQRTGADRRTPQAVHGGGGHRNRAPDPLASQSMSRSPSHRRRATLASLAAELKVSRTTISNAYNRPDQLSADLRERIFATAKRIGYAGPDPVARSLRTRKAGAVGLVITEPLTYSFSDPAALNFVAGLAESCEEVGSGPAVGGGRSPPKCRRGLQRGAVGGRGRVRRLRGRRRRPLSATGVAAATACGGRRSARRRSGRVPRRHRRPHRDAGTGRLRHRARTPRDRAADNATRQRTGHRGRDGLDRRHRPCAAPPGTASRANVSAVCTTPWSPRG